MSVECNCSHSSVGFKALVFLVPTELLGFPYDQFGRVLGALLLIIHGVHALKCSEEDHNQLVTPSWVVDVHHLL